MQPFVQPETIPKSQGSFLLTGERLHPPKPKAIKRLRELDFLRGMAILLVLCRHQELFAATTTMGWIGVDLFFVLSGFLVSGLLFKEYQRFGNIKPKNFLIRRGFKIYPIYYLFYLPYLFLLVGDGAFSASKVLGDLFFVQNYANGFGYAYAASWSLAIEEHFYFGFAVFLFFGLKFNWLCLRKEGGEKRFRFTELWVVVVGFMLTCFLVRVITNIYLPEKYLTRSFTMTHLRIDSLLAGVLVAYFYHYKPVALKAFYQRAKLPLAVVTTLCLSWTPFVKPLQPFFIRTVGFTLLYIGFGALLLTFLLDDKINQKLNRCFSRPVVDFVSKIGFCSYSVYVIHTLSNTVVHGMGIENHFLAFFLSTGISVACGFAMTQYIETWFLKLRDKWFPSRTA